MVPFTLLYVSSLAILVSIVCATSEVKFSYSGLTGPAFWDKLPGSDEICRVGKNQSPIDITFEGFTGTGKCRNVVKNRTLDVSFRDACDVWVKNDDNTIEVSKEEGLPANLRVASGDYELENLHFHTPSEHRVNGRYFDMEAHFVFKTKDKEPKIAVIAVFFNVGKRPNKFLKPIIKSIPLRKGGYKKAEFLELSKILYDINFLKDAYTYSGSLTTPPCSEGVSWWVSHHIQSISKKQYKVMKGVMGFNSRFNQVRYEYC